MLEYFNRLKPRERILVSVASVVVVIAMLYLFLLEPFTQKADQLENRTAGQQRDVQWMKNAAIEVAQLQKGRVGNNVGNSGAGQSLLVIVDNTSKRIKLAQNMKRLEPDGSDRVRVWLENAPFDQLARWMSLLETDYKLHVESAVIDKTDDQGKVNARIVFIGGAT